MKFGELFSNSWKELKLNFKLNSKIVFNFVLVPGLVALIFSIISFYTQNSAFNYLALIVQIVAIFTGVLASTSLIYSTLFNKKDYISSTSGGKKFFWKYISLMLVQFIFLILLALALIIPAIIFGVYWMLSEFVLIKENKGVMDSLRGSFRLIRNNWWRVLGYSILLGLIGFGIQMLFSIPSWPTGIMVMLDTAKNPGLYVNTAVPTNLSIINNAISRLFSLFSQLIIIPLGIIFSKYLYLGLQKKKS